MKTKEAIRLAENIKWKSTDKDNMEFSADVTCFQKDAVAHLIEQVHKLRNVISHATGGALHNEQDLDRSTNDICVEISKHHNRIWEEAQ